MLFIGRYCYGQTCSLRLTALHNICTSTNPNTDQTPVRALISQASLHAHTRTHLSGSGLFLKAMLQTLTGSWLLLGLPLPLPLAGAGGATWLNVVPLAGSRMSTTPPWRDTAMTGVPAWCIGIQCNYAGCRIALFLIHQFVKVRAGKMPQGKRRQAAHLQYMTRSMCMVCWRLQQPLSTNIPPGHHHAQISWCLVRQCLHKCPDYAACCLVTMFSIPVAWCVHVQAMQLHATMDQHQPAA